MALVTSSGAPVPGRVLSRPARAAVVVAKRTISAGAALAAAGAASIAGVFGYEAYLSREECSVSVPLRPRPRGAVADPDADVAERSCIVIGGGVVGVTTAYFLARRGFEVTLLERRRGPAEEASAVNAGWLRASAAGPLRQLDILRDVAKDQFRGLPFWTALRVWATGLDLGYTTMLREYVGDLQGTEVPEQPKRPLTTEERAMLAYDSTYFVDWVGLLSGHFRFAVCVGAIAASEALRALFGGEDDVAVEKSRADAMAALSTRSLKLLRQIAHDEKIDVLFKFPGQVCVLPGDATTSPKLVPKGACVEAWDKERVLQELSYLRGSAAESRTRMALASTAEDGIADCAAFTEQLARVCKERYGVKFRFGAEVRELQLDDMDGSGHVVSRAQCADGRRFTAGFFVLANGAAADTVTQCIIDKHCAKPRPIFLPLCGVRGYSFTLPASEVPKEHMQALARWPCVSWEDSHVVLSAYPDADGSVRAVRFTSIAEVGADKAPSAACSEALRKKAMAVFPSLAERIAGEKVASGFRPQSADDVPIVSGTRSPNLFVNVGHGGYGWRLACGSAELLAALVDAPREEPGAAALDGANAAIARCVSLSRFAGWKIRRKARADGMEFPELSQAVGPMELVWSVRMPGVERPRE